MQRDIVIKGRSLGGCSDLTLLAPIKPGFVESLESVTYKTRIKRVLEALHGARVASHEHHAARLISDAVERVGAIHSVRVAVLEPENKVLLAVTFDGSWESYIRVLWDKVGSLLDLIFCGTVGYVTAHGHTFDAWEAWARQVQVETGFFYGPPDSTARDALYLRRIERMRGRGLGEVAHELQAVLPSAEQAVQRLVDPPGTLQPDDPAIDPVPAARMVRERVRNGLRGLAALYRLADLHRPGTPDGDVLRRAALDLLLEFTRMHDRDLIDHELAEEHNRFERQLEWLLPHRARPVLVRRPVPALPHDEYAVDAAVRADVQGGILRTHDGVTHGLVLMLAFDGAAAVRAVLAAIEPAPNSRTSWLTRDSDDHTAQPGTVFRTLAFTLAGLRVAGLGEDALELFPEEFRQGMAARAGLLGDVRSNHPRRWRLPKRFVDVDQPPGTDTIELDGVHAVLQLRCKAEGEAALRALELHDPGHPLQQEVRDLARFAPGLRLLAVQPLRRNYEDLSTGRKQITVEHFGYADGDGQPQMEWTKDERVRFKRNRVPLGEIVLGHDNAADAAVDLDDPTLPKTVKTRQRWLRNGSFLALRKYRQFASRIEAAVTATAGVMAKTLTRPLAECAEIVYAKLLGRDRDGVPLIDVDAEQLNVFTYDLDRMGQACPLHAHIRRAHPRLRPDAAARAPRIMRRSMSYGPQRKDDTADAEADRGLVFMAYNASLAEQFEVVQRWLVGGNSTGTSSATSCPIVGVPENGLPRDFRFEHQGHVFSVRLDGGNKLFDEPQVVTRLEWGLYLFTPSLTALRGLRTAAAAAAATAPAAATLPWQVQRGRQLIAALHRIEVNTGRAAARNAWKTVLEDPEAIDRLDAAAVWAAIREDHSGLLRTPYGVLVASRELVSEVFADPHGRYSVCGQLRRMKRSFGEIALGMDEGARYRELSEKINAAIGELTGPKVFELAHRTATNKLDSILETAKNQSGDVEDARFEAGFDMREVLDEVLATLSEEWFGLQNDPNRRLRRGSTDWSWQPGEPPLYPGHFTALSRYMFQPNPGRMAVELGKAYGQALREAMRLFVADHRSAGTIPKRADGTFAPLSYAVFTDPAHGNIAGNRTRDDHDDLVARTMVGVLMGFNPTIIGAVLNVLREWQRDGSFGALRARLAGDTTFETADQVLGSAMAAAARMRPMPQLGWRTALVAHRLGPAGAGGVKVSAGEKIVLGTASATQQSLADGQPDGRLMFGGVRTAPSATDPTPRPTHACPGYEAGIGAMLGALTALLARSETLRHDAAPLTFVLEGDMATRAAAASSPAVAKMATPRSTGGFIFAWGDSWMDFPTAKIDDLRDCLERSGYQIPATYCKYTVWPKAKTMAADTEDFCNDLDSFMLSPQRPVAILLSAGGNDSTGETLLGLLNPKDIAQPGQPVLNPTARAAHIDGLCKHYTKILDAIKRVLDNYQEHPVPIFVHGYDYPIPLGHVRGFPAITYPARWLREPFENRGYRLANANDMSLATHAMRDLIDDLNKMLEKLRDSYPTGFLHHVDFRKIIETGRLGNPKIDWFDDLHPTGEAFALMAGKLGDAIGAEVAKNFTKPGQRRARAAHATSSSSPRTPPPPAR